MPRKRWNYKNRYCRASKLTEDAFKGLARCYLKLQSAKDSVEVLKQEHSTKISRQSVTNYFLRFGAYLFNEFFILHSGVLNISMNLIKPEVKAVNGFLEIHNNNTSIVYPRFKLLEQYNQNNDVEKGSPESIVAKCIVYAMQYQSFLNDEKLSEGDNVVSMPDNRFIVSLLRYDIASSKGMDNESFPYHFGRAYFIDTVIGAYFRKLQEEYTGRDIELFLREDVQERLLCHFLNMLEKNPLSAR